MSEKKPATRVYPIRPDAEVNKLIYIEAVSQAAAILHVFKPHVGRPLTGSEVAAVVRDGGKIEVAS